jgi:L-histidine Nalpha-methyltransferase
MHLVARRAHVVTVRTAGVVIPFEVGDDIWTENSYKFTRPGIEAMLDGADLKLDACLTDREGRFALALAKPA